LYEERQVHLFCFHRTRRHNLPNGTTLMRISVIMPVNLGYYKCDVTQSASHPEIRFMYAVRSFLSQVFKDAELIIISDGDRKVEDIWTHLWVGNPSIRFKYIDKREPYSGVVRNVGLEMAGGDIICYLDHDNVFGPNHLRIIDENFDTREYDWVYYNYYLVDTVMADKVMRNVDPVYCSIDTGAIAHKRSIGVEWETGYGHDWWMIEKYLLPLKSMKIPTPEYYFCHFRKIEDF